MGDHMIECPVCGKTSDNIFFLPDCEHYNYVDAIGDYLAHVACAQCGEVKPFSIRTSDAEGGQFYCGIDCLRATLLDFGRYS